METMPCRWISDATIRKPASIISHPQTPPVNLRYNKPRRMQGNHPFTSRTGIGTLLESCPVCNLVANVVYKPIEF